MRLPAYAESGSRAQRRNGMVGCDTSGSRAAMTFAITFGGTPGFVCYNSPCRNDISTGRATGIPRQRDGSGFLREEIRDHASVAGVMVRWVMPAIGEERDRWDPV